jgi:O-antigen/teichoic acid export membrane protein
MQETPTETHPIALEGPAPIEAALVLPAPAGSRDKDRLKAGLQTTDTLALGVVLLLASTVLQRAVGFAREICFCRWLSPEQLGKWDMAFGFLMMAGPLLVMSLPGTFGRYVERYRQAGQLRSFFRRTAGFCMLMATPLLSAIVVFRGVVSYVVFGSRDHEAMVLLMAAATVFIIGFNYMVCVFTSLRNMKVVSLIELGNSVFFGVLGIGLLCCGQANAGAMVVAYGISCLLCVVCSGAWLARSWRTFPQEPVCTPHGELWSRLLPLAAWILINNMLWNLFDVVDRYMIVHLLPGTPAEALAEVGNYRSSRVLPLLLSSITIMIAGALLPHLSHDWEAGRRRQVSDRLNMFLKIWSVLLTAGAAVVLFAAPTLFRVGFQSKFAGGLQVLPLTLTYCTWFGLSMLLQTYLWCAERAYVASIVAALGVLVNVGLNLVLLPRLGLQGAVLATATANGTALLLMSLLCRRYGFRLQRGTIVGLFLPFIIPLGPWVILLILTAVIVEAITTDRFLSREEKHEIFAGAEQYLGKLRPRPRGAGLQPAGSWQVENLPHGTEP